MPQLALDFTDPVVTSLISPGADICTLAPGSLWATVRVASAEQLRMAMQMLNDDVARGRKPVLAAAMARLGRMEVTR